MYSSSRGFHTATGIHMPYGITQCYLPPGRGDIPALIDCMRQGLCSGTVSVRRSVPAIGRCSRVRRVCCRGPGGQAISIDCCGRRAPAPQQHGAQQQMRAVSRCQLSEQFLNGTSAHNRPFQCHYMVLRLKTKYS